jgi:hypothetical protein
MRDLRVQDPWLFPGLASFPVAIVSAIRDDCRLPRRLQINDIGE